MFLFLFICSEPLLRLSHRIFPFLLPTHPNCNLRFLIIIYYFFLINCSQWFSTFVVKAAAVVKQVNIVIDGVDALQVVYLLL